MNGGLPRFEVLDLEVLDLEVLDLEVLDRYQFNRDKKIVAVWFNPIATIFLIRFSYSASRVGTAHHHGH
jgi:hypothetical protein